MPAPTTLDRESYRIAWISLIIGVVALLVGLYTIKDDIQYAVRFDSIPVHSCPDRITKAREILLRESSAVAPAKAGIRFEPSTTEPGRVDAYLAWINPSDLQEGAIAMSGVYGVPSSSDGWVDQSQPSGSSGQCWNWYAYAARDDAQPETVSLVITGLWAKQKYCFYDMYKTTGGGWSKPSAVACKVA
jgi:hypothetical protein